MSPLGEVARFSIPALAAVATTVIVSGLLRLRRAQRSRGLDGGSRHARRRRAARERDERSLARWWIGVGLALALSLLLLPPFAIAVAGTVTAAALAARGRTLSMRRAGAAMGCTVVMAIFAAGLFGVVAVAEVVSSFSHTEDGAGGEGAGEGKGAGTSPFDYAQLCPGLPDPLQIGHGLGELFEHDGAVEAGCGGPAEEVAGSDSVWFSLGMCEGSLRSLAVRSETHEPVLLYGAPAQFAWEAARAGRLLYAEVANPGAGDLDIVTTVDGSYVFARSTPSIHPGSEAAKRCGDVDEVARPFVMLPPSLAELWAQDVFESGWTWPLRAERGSFAFLDAETEELHANGGCRAEDSCYFQPVGDADRRVFAGAAAVTLDELTEYMPPSTG